MTTEDKLKAFRARIDEAQQFIEKYSIAAAMAYLIELKGEELTIWILAITEWQASQPPATSKSKRD